MKKQFKTAIIATIITCMILISCACAMPAKAERPEFYPILTVVVNSVRIEDDLWIVDCRDKDGHVHSFFDDEGTWEYGDVANLLMWATEVEEEDEVIEVYWEGYTEDIEQFFETLEWRH